MSEQLIISGETKQERYEALLPQIKAVVEDEPDLIANMANVAAMLHKHTAALVDTFYRCTALPYSVIKVNVKVFKFIYRKF